MYEAPHEAPTETSIVATGNDFFVFLQVSIALKFFTSPLQLLRPLCMRVPTNSSLVLCCDQTSLCPSANVCNLHNVPEWSMWIRWLKANKKHVLFTAVADFCDPGQRVFWFCLPSNLLTALLRGVERVHVLRQPPQLLSANNSPIQVVKHYCHCSAQWATYKNGTQKEYELSKNPRYSIKRLIIRWCRVLFKAAVVCCVQACLYISTDWRNMCCRWCGRQ